MKILALLAAAKAALVKGEIIAHPEKWKSAQVLSMALVAVAVPTYSAFCSTADACYGVSGDDVTTIATWAGGAAFAIFQIWTTLATSRKVGIGRAKGPAGDSGSGPGGMREPGGQDRPAPVSPHLAGDRGRRLPGTEQNRKRDADDFFGAFGPD